jgi:hypothetical protein
MSEKTIARKLFIKAGQRLLFVGAPEGYRDLLGPLPDKVTVLRAAEAPIDMIQVFVASRADLEAQLPRLKQLLAPKGMLWVTYHKGTSRVKTDIHRDSINAYAKSIGLEGVAMISIDDDWSALRLKLV